MKLNFKYPYMIIVNFEVPQNIFEEINLIDLYCKHSKVYCIVPFKIVHESCHAW